MAARNRLPEIRELRQLLDEAQRFFMAASEIEKMANEAQKAESNQRTLDVYPVRAVSHVEVQCRQLVREIVESKQEFARRAVPLLTHAKPDYELLLSVSDDEVTFSDIVAHSVSFSNLSDIFTVFEQLLDTKLSRALPVVTDRFGYASSPEQKPLIEDYDSDCSNIAQLYVLRHRICHEALAPASDALAGTATRIHSLARFIGALHGLVIHTLYSDLPRTQLELNVQAHERLRSAQTELDRYTAQFKERYHDRPDHISLFDTAQAAWGKYVDAQQNLRHDPSGGGSIGPMLRADEAEVLTRERADRVKWFAERAEGDL